MKLLFDNNLSGKLTEVIQPYFPESKHVVDLGVSHFDDKEIWEFAKDGSYSIVTKDRDFYYLATTLGHPPKIIWLTVGNCRNKMILELLLKTSMKFLNFYQTKRIF